MLVIMVYMLKCGGRLGVDEVVGVQKLQWKNLIVIVSGLFMQMWNSYGGILLIMSVYMQSMGDVYVENMWMILMMFWVLWKCMLMLLKKSFRLVVKMSMISMLVRMVVMFSRDGVYFSSRQIVSSMVICGRKWMNVMMIVVIGNSFWGRQIFCISVLLLMIEFVVLLNFLLKRLMIMMLENRQIVKLLML